MIRRTKVINYNDINWDGTDRRKSLTCPWEGPERREDNPCETYEIVPHEQSEKVSPVQEQTIVGKLFSKGPVLAALVPVLLGVGGFFADTMHRITSLEYKQISFSEKMEEDKKALADVKQLLKDNDKSKRQLEEQIKGIEETIMQLYQKRK